MAVSLPRHSQTKLNHILRHAAAVFADRGFEGPCMRDISRASGVSLAGLYCYVESKQELLYIIKYQVFTDVLDRLDRMGIPNARGTSQEEAVLEEPYRQRIAALKRRYYPVGRDIFAELARRRTAPPLHPRLAVLSLYGMMNWIYPWHNVKVDLGAERLAGRHDLRDLSSRRALRWHAPE